MHLCCKILLIALERPHPLSFVHSSGRHRRRVSSCSLLRPRSQVCHLITHLCEVAREKPRSITELAAVLQRDRKAVHRDVQALHSVGMLLLRKEPNPGHGQVQVVTAAASRFQLVAEV